MPLTTPPIGAAIARLVSNAELRQQLAERGRARAPQFSQEVQAKAMARAYRRSPEPLEAPTEAQPPGPVTNFAKRSSYPASFMARSTGFIRILPTLSRSRFTFTQGIPMRKSAMG